MPARSQHRQAEEGVRHEGDVDGMRLLTPTQPQWTRNGLETDLLIQVAFSRRVSDLVTQPVLEVGGRRIAPTMVLTLGTDLPGRPLVHLVEVDAGDGRLDAATLAADRSWCAERGVGFHVLGAEAVGTDRLANARLMTQYVGLWPLDEDVDEIAAAVARGGGRCSVGEATDAIVAAGVGLQDAEHAVRQASANWFFECDLFRRYDRDSTLKRVSPGSHRDSAEDPFLAFLHPEKWRSPPG